MVVGEAVDLFEEVGVCLGVARVDLQDVDLAGGVRVAEELDAERGVLEADLPHEPLRHVDEPVGTAWTPGAGRGTGAGESWDTPG